MAFVFDIETNGLLDETTVIHSLVLYGVESGNMISFADQEGYPPVSAGVAMLRGSEVIGHNIMCFDIPVIQKFYPDFKVSKIIDTLIISRLIYTDIFEKDMRSKVKGMLLGKKLAGRHSLDSWGVRLREFKGDFGKDTDWQSWSKEMQEYCIQDVVVQTKLYKMFMEKDYSERAIDLEHSFQQIIYQQQRNGVPFDVEAAQKLYYELKTESESLTEEIQKTVPPMVTKTPFTPKRDNKTLGYKKDVTILKVKETPFNPGSRKQIVDHLQKQYNWVPVDFTDKGNPKMGSEQLDRLPYPEIPLISKYLDASKVKGRLMNNKNEGWLTQHKEGRIHAWMITNGAVTGRCTHRIISNIPRITSYRGEECRALFHAGEGVMVGCDAAQLELRMLAHYMAVYDEGAYAKQVCDGDIHTVNQNAAGLDTRDKAKTFIYALLYGAGDKKIGSIVDPTASEREMISRGKALRSKFYAAIPAYAMLVGDVKRSAKRGYLFGLDGRELKVRGDHMALNTLLQGAGAVVMKQATVNQWRLFREIGLNYHVFQTINYHDENQVITSTCRAEEIGLAMVDAVRCVAYDFSLRCPLDAEYKIGKNWAETH